MTSVLGLFGRLLSRLSVGRKLMLIYLLDLTAVIFVSSIMINEKYLAINFAKKEIQGNAYIAQVRDNLLGAALADGAPPSSDPAQAVMRAQEALGDGMQAEEQATALVGAYARLQQAQPAQRRAALAELLTLGRALITRVGNQSNLILDPDLDSYYTMSLVLLRYPELLDLIEGIESRLEEQTRGGRLGADARTRYLILEGQIEAVRSGIEADHAEAYAAGQPALRASLQPGQLALAEAIATFQAAARAWVEEGARPQGLAAVGQARHALLQALQVAWGTSGSALDGLLEARIAHQYSRMWLHLGTALALLFAILGIVYFVSRQIAAPLRHLAAVTDHVRRTGDHSRRAEWSSSDEIGRLVVGFNEMLAQLDHERETQKELAATARAAEAQRALVEATPIALIVTAIPGHEVLHANPPAEAWIGAGRDDPWRRGLESHVRARFFQQLADRGGVDGYEVRWRGPAEPAWAMLSARQVHFQGQDAVLTAFTPINHLKQLERRLDLWAKVFETSSECILILDGQRRIVTANPALYRHTGHETADVIGQPPEMLMALPGAEDGAAREAWWVTVSARGHWQGELLVQRRNGSEYPAWLMVNVVRQSGGEVSHYIFTSLDVSDRKKSEQRIRYLADHDALTGLPNRSLCTERLRLATQQARRDGRRVGVLFIDLDAFKDINDSLGHHVGDGLLRSVAQRLSEAMREGDTVSRMGGDEFVIIINGIEGSNEIAEIVETRLIPRIRAPHEVEGSELHVSCSVGIAVFPDDADDIDQLMKSADTAMYQAKAQGKDAAAFFSAEMTERAQARLHLAAHLRRALELGQLSLHWQPRVAAASGQLVGVEGLLRWTHPERGMVSPGQFIPLAEEIGLIVPIGAWVIEEACRQARAWREQGLPPFVVSINLSARQFADQSLPDTVRQSLERHGLPKGSLELELTETVLMDGAERNLHQLHALRRLGVSLAVDDFGTGYSSLAYLNRFPIDKLKIDRGFVQRMLGDTTDRAITLAIIRLGHTLGLQVVAEGVEGAREAALLREAGCDELQGYLFARPMPVEELPGWLARRDLQALTQA